MLFLPTKNGYLAQQNMDKKNTRTTSNKNNATQCVQFIAHTPHRKSQLYIVSPLIHSVTGEKELIHPMDSHVKCNKSAPDKVNNTKEF